ncbi:unnamed protein product [Ixodes hexagonus]
MAASLQAQPSKSGGGLPTTVGELRQYFRHHGLDVSRPCSALQNAASTAIQRCWVFESLAVWNRVLHCVCAEILEDHPGRLTVQTFGLRPPNKKYNVVGVFLLATLLNGHPCVRHVDIKHVSNLVGDVDNLFEHVVLNEGIQKVALAEHRPWPAERKYNAHNLIHAVLNGDPNVLRFHSIDFSRSLREALCEVTANSSRLSELTLRDSLLPTLQVVSVLEAVKSSTSITSLTLDRNDMLGEGAECIADLLKSNTTLVELSLWDTMIDDEGAVAIAAGLEANRTLRKLNLGMNDILASGVHELSRALKTNTSLRVLDLQKNHFKDGGATYLAEMLRQNVTLQDLNISNTVMTETGLRKIADSLKSNRSLLVLTVHGTFFRSGGTDMIELTSLLGVNNTLNRLNCWSTFARMDQAQFDDFVEAMVHHQAIDGLEIGINTSGEALKLLQTIQFNKTVRHLSIIRGNQYDISPLISALKKNESVEVFEVDHLLGVEVTALGGLLKETTTIRSVTLSYPVNVSGFISLMCGLSQNKSILKFSLDCTQLKEQHCRKMARMLARNKTLHHLLLHDAPAHAAGLPVLARALSMNETLQQLAITYPTSSATWFRVRGCLRRNCSRMARAVEFALTKVVEKKAAEAFEFFRRSEFFVQKLVDAAGDLQQATAILSEADVYLLRNYFVLTGVVKEMLVCLRFSDNAHATLIDSLDEYCLLEVTSYLKISDVK